jgi:uncharacterized protein (TIGR02996 family)
MSQDEAFIGAVLAAPRDDSPRLAYAGWLNQRGDARGHYLRTEMQWAQASGSGTKSCKQFEEAGMLEVEPCFGIGATPMRGRKPRPLRIAARDLPILQGVARARHLAWFQVQHARIVLAVAAGESIGAIAGRLECHPATVWRVCRRYEQGGLKALLLDEPRLGRPQEISPPAACSNHQTGLPGAHRRGVAYHPLDQQGPGQPGESRWHRDHHKPTRRPADPQRRGSAAASHSLLEDLATR